MLPEYHYKFNHEDAKFRFCRASFPSSSYSCYGCGSMNLRSPFLDSESTLIYIPILLKIWLILIQSTVHTLSQLVMSSIKLRSLISFSIFREKNFLMYGPCPGLPKEKKGHIEMHDPPSFERRKLSFYPRMLIFFLLLIFRLSMYSSCRAPSSVCPGECECVSLFISFGASVCYYYYCSPSHIHAKDIIITYSRDHSFPFFSYIAVHTVW